MRVPTIRIEQQYAQLAVRTVPARLELHNQFAQLTMERSPAVLNFTRTPLKASIDQYPSRVDIGYRFVVDQAHWFADLARQAGMEAIARIAEEGDKFAQIETKTNPIPEIARANLSEEIDVNVGLMPENKPEIQWQLGKIEVQYIPGKTTYQNEPGKVTGEYYRGKVEITLARQAYIRIIPPEAKIDLKM